MTRQTKRKTIRERLAEHRRDVEAHCIRRYLARFPGATVEEIAHRLRLAPSVVREVIDARKIGSGQ